MPEALSDIVDDAEAAVAALEEACESLNKINARDEVSQRGEIERLVVLLQRVDSARQSVSWSENWV